MAAGQQRKAQAPSKSEAVKEIGVAGFNHRNGISFEEFLPELRGHRAVRKYREMRDNDPLIGAVLQAMDMLLRGVEWRTEPADDSAEAQEAAEFVDGVFGDMSGTHEEFISEVLSFLVFGWAFFEIVFKRRDGPEQNNPERRSRFTDGRIGVRKLAPRSQATLERWLLDEQGGVTAMVQKPPGSGEVREIPIEKGLLFRTVTANNQPNGRSVLRNAYRPYYYATHIENLEGIAIERELNGLPVVKMPGDYLTAAAGSEKGQIRDKYEQMVRDVRYNEQGGVLMPSDMWPDQDGNPSSQPLVEFKLMASEGTRDIDTGKTITRYRQDMARTLLADFVMLGVSEKGSFALSKSKTELFVASLEGYLQSIAAVINRHLLPRLWRLNGFNPDLVPQRVPGDIGPVDLEELGGYINKLAGAGAAIFPNEELERALLDVAGLPSEQQGDPDMLGRTEE